MRLSYLTALVLAFAVAYLDVSFVSASTVEQYRSRFKRKKRHSSSPSKKTRSILGKRKRKAEVDEEEDGPGEAKKTKKRKFRFRKRSKRRHKKKKSWLKNRFGKKHKKSHREDEAQDDEVDDKGKFDDLKETLNGEIAKDIKENPLTQGFKHLSQAASSIKDNLITALDNDVSREINRFVPQIAVAA